MRDHAPRSRRRLMGFLRNERGDAVMQWAYLAAILVAAALLADPDLTYDLRRLGKVYGLDLGFLSFFH